MLYLLAESEAERVATQWYWAVTLIIVIGAATLLLLVMLALGRRWARRQHLAIEKEKAERREKRSAERVDAWQTSAERYVDRDKLPDAPPGDQANDDAGDDEIDPPGPASFQDQEEHRDPYGLFHGMPYEETDDDDDDDDDFDEEEGEDFDDEDDPRR